MDDKPERRYPVHLEGGRWEGAVYLVTVCTKDRKRILDNDLAHDSIVRAWVAADHWLVGRYVIMPDHVHLFCALGKLDGAPLTNWIAYWKSLTSKAWQRPEDRPLWQQQFWDTRIRPGKGQQKWEYVANNPVRAGLVIRSEDWPYQGEINRI